MNNTIINDFNYNTISITTYDIINAHSLEIGDSISNNICCICGSKLEKI